MRCTCENATREGICKGLEMAAQHLEAGMKAVAEALTAGRWDQDMRKKSVSPVDIMVETNRMFEEIVADLRAMKPKSTFDRRFDDPTD